MSDGTNNTPGGVGAGGPVADSDLVSASTSASASASAPTATPSAVADSPAAQKASAVKDKNCPYCGQAFTSSSLGRHLDLYIKERNPKPPDGIHDVEAIRRMRESITRRQPRGSLARRDTSNPGTPSALSGKSPAAIPDLAIKPPAIPKEGQFVVDRPNFGGYPFQPSWQVTGVINDIPTTVAGPSSGMGNAWENHARASPTREMSSRAQNHSQRASSRVAHKVQFDAKQRLTDAMDTARAAELALREVLSSIRAAKQHVDMNSLPFDFEPLALDFPALTLQCLQAPPTLFSSTPHPTSNSWSIQPPGPKQYEALQAYFNDEFQKWHVACATATTISAEDLTYPPSETGLPLDMREGVKRAEKAAASLEKQVHEHLQSTYQVWEQLSPQRRNELWVLELARSVGRRQREQEKTKELHHALKQENANLKTQIEQLNRLQQPREFRIVPPATIPIEETFMNYLLSLGASGVRGVGLTVEDRHVDLNTMVSRAIDRWKTVIVSSRGAGMGGQKPLDQTTHTNALGGGPPAMPLCPPAQHGAQHGTQHGAQHGAGPQSHLQIAHGLPAPLVTGPSATTAVSSAADEDNSDEDADAEMDEVDTFTPIVPVTTKAPVPMQSQMELSQMRDRQRGVMGGDTQLTMNGKAGMDRGMGVRRPMPNTASPMGAQRPQPGHINNDEYAGSGNQGVLCSDHMYSM
ncbi:hypothetical protein GGR50DRAFT_695297 [Xylaria sp. CBS 124048]|nr:hypothetical protein GGR50DRAFT_695297 [Xylaria sp. CBS 124048]